MNFYILNLTWYEIFPQQLNLLNLYSMKTEDINIMLKGKKKMGRHKYATLASDKKFETCFYNTLL